MSMKRVARSLSLGAAALLWTVTLPPSHALAQGYLLPPFEACLAKAERGGDDAPTRSDCYWRYQTSKSRDGP